MKYYCKCGKEIENLVIFWESSVGRLVAYEVSLLCREHAEGWCKSPWKEGVISTNIRIKINVGSKEAAVSQVIAQYLNSKQYVDYLPRTDVKRALSKVTKSNK